MSETNQDTMRKKIYLAALLHDIGKFWQRASGGFEADDSNLSVYTKELCEYICPKNQQGRFGYYHVLWTAEFFDKFNIKIPEPLRAKVSHERDLDTTANLAAYHHNPSTELQALVSLADEWSSGSDRLREPDFEAEEGDFRSVALRNIFDVIDTKSFYNGKTIEEPKASYYDLRFLKMSEEDLFPKENLRLDKEKYQSLWNAFIKDFEQIPNDTAGKFIETLYFVLLKHLHGIPSDTRERPVITSLFEHSKSTAAFASVLYDYWLENNETLLFSNINGKKKAKVKEGHYPALLLGGDVSGIQNFIYNIHNNKAAKSLKGRSFYIQLLTDAIIRRIIFDPEIDLNWANVIYAAGGKFYLLLPNTERVKKRLSEITWEVEKDLFEKHGMSLAFLWDTQAFRIESKQVDGNWKTRGFIPESVEAFEVGVLWKLVAEKLQNKKERKFSLYLFSKEENGRVINTLFNPLGTGGDVKVDAVTGEELEEGNYESLEGDIFVSKKVYEQIELGRVLSDVDYILVYRNNEDNQYVSTRAKHLTEVAGIHYYLFDQEELTENEADFRFITSIDYGHLIRINNTDFLVTLKGKNASYGFQFYGGNKQAKKDRQQVKTFSELTYLEDQFYDDNQQLGDVKHTYLGVLRMDVDNLGKIFQKGLSKTTGTFAVYSTLSGALDMFFSGYLNLLREKYKDYVNILYSGGDDLFIVGRWDKVLEMAFDIREKFRNYTHREDLSISGGMVLIRPKFPIRKAAEQSGAMEEAAKTKFETKGKNALGFLGKTFQWDQWRSIKERAEYWKELVTDEKWSSGILHRIMEFYEFKNFNDEEENDVTKEKNSSSMAYIWNSLYYLTRQMERISKREDGKRVPKEGYEAAYAELGKLREEMLSPSNYDYLAAVARLAELWVRLEKDFKKIRKEKIT